MSFYISLTGLNAASTQLSVTSNNIANVGTTAFKRSRADFGDIFATSPLQKASTVIGQGVALKSVSQEFSQGNIQFSANSLDMALTGDGFFMVQSVDGSQTIFTRNGGFQLDESNVVVNSAGQKLLAAKVDELGGAEFQGVQDMQALRIPRLTEGKAVATTEIDLSINLPKSAPVIPSSVVFDPNKPETYSLSTSMNVYDKANNKYLAKVYYVKTQEPSETDPTGKWQTHTYVNGEPMRENLMQATDVEGKAMYVNKFGQLLTADEITELGQTTAVEPSRIYTLDVINNNKIDSKPGTYAGTLADNLFTAGSYTPTANKTITMELAVDSDNPSADKQAISFTLTAGQSYTGSELAKELENAINLKFGELADSDDQRYGIKVKFAADSTGQKGAFTISSGTTGEESNIRVLSVAGDTTTIFGFTADTSELDLTDPAYDVIASGSGLASQSAVLMGETFVGLGDRFLLNAANSQFVVTVDNVVDTIELPTTVEYTRESFLAALEEKINAMDNDSGRTVSGVKVAFEEVGNALALKFTSGTQGSSAFIKVSGAESWGLAKAPSASGETVKWVDPYQAQYVATNRTESYVDIQGNELDGVEDVGDIEEDGIWAPVFLDKGELTFDRDGKLFSPANKIAYNGPFVNFSVDYTGTTNYNAPLAVLSQLQNGKPEGDLIGVTVGNDGLVTANYSNGIQEKLGKIILANFTAPTGLRQLGDSSFVATAEAGTLSLGEPGEAGFAAVRAGATERSNVDLTQELIELITAQRNFQANAKAIETANTMTQAIVNIRS
jgi:flagellar hook-basal body protein